MLLSTINYHISRIPLFVTLFSAFCEIKEQYFATATAHFMLGGGVNRLDREYHSGKQTGSDWVRDPNQLVSKKQLKFLYFDILCITDTD